MPFTWDGFIALAEYLLTAQPDNAAALRACVSRSYYYSFHEGKNFLIRHGLEVIFSKDADVHGKVIQCLENASDIRISKIGTSLDRMRKARNSADYDDQYSLNQNKVRKVINDAHVISNSLKSIPARTGISTSYNGMKVISA